MFTHGPQSVFWTGVAKRCRMSEPLSGLSPEMAAETASDFNDHREIVQKSFGADNGSRPIRRHLSKLRNDFGHFNDRFIEKINGTTGSTPAKF